MIDPSEIESRFAIEDGMAYMASIFTEPSEEAQAKIGQVLQILENLPPREADFVDLYYFRRLKQTDIAAIFNVSQPTVCYRLQRATARIHFLLQMPQVGDEELQQTLADFLSDPLDVKIMRLMRETTCQSEVAKQLKVSQGLVRHRFIRTLNRMRDWVWLPSRERRLDQFRTQVAERNLRSKTQALRAIHLLLDRVPLKDQDQAEMQLSLESPDPGQLWDTAFLLARKLVDHIQQVRKRTPIKIQEQPETHQAFARFVLLFDFIASNLNILREVQRPAWDNRVTHLID